MANGLKEVIKKLEQQRTSIDRALSALREIDEPGLESSVPESSNRRGSGRGKRKGGMTPEGRKRLSEALRKRWAAKRAAEGRSESSTGTTARKGARKGGMTPEGRKRLSEALRKRWAAKRAAKTAAPAKRSGAR